MIYAEFSVLKIPLGFDIFPTVYKAAWNYRGTSKRNEQYLKHYLMCTSKFISRSDIFIKNALIKGH
ncbi:hypothetical protein GCM10023261_07160 [Bartonella jaculi]|uniref:Uncharacterized protein n=1 Tax=Bartonella jaculi TaxID=686226 RepID=A0ABP9N1A8_9HYPH